MAAKIEAPFPGLRPFQTSEAHLYFGRDEQTEALLARLAERRMLAVVGASGSGKSSLVRAGLMPALERGYLGPPGLRWVIAVLSHPGIGPLEGLARALAEAFQSSVAEILGVLTQSSAGLSDFAGRVLGPTEQLMVVVDQFEELFRYRRQTGDQGRVESTAFIKLLLTATGNSDLAPRFVDPPVYAVLTMRSDYIGKCAQFRGLPEALNDAPYLVPRLTRDQQREAIEGPIALAGAEITDLLVERILNDAGDDPDQLPVLQHALLRVWEESVASRARNEALDLPHYEDPAVGGITDALNRDAENAYGRLKSSAEEAIARRMFQRLVEPGTEDEETRRPTLLSEIVSVCGAPENEVRAVIEVFRKRGFLTLTRAIPDTVDLLVDISHESLIRKWNRLKSWVDEEGRSAAIYSRLSESALNLRALYRGPDLAEAVRWERKESPSQYWASRYNSDPKAWESAIKFLRRSEMHQKLVPVGYALLVAAVVPMAVFFWLVVGQPILSGLSTRSVIAVLSVLSLVTGPTVVVLALYFYWLRPQTPLMPLVIPVIPLGMTSVSIYLIATCLAVTKGFGDLADAASPGPSGIARVLLQNRYSLLWRLTELGVCVVVALLFQLTRPAPAIKDRQLPALPRSTALLIAATVLAICLTVSLSSDIVRLSGMVIHTRTPETDALLAGLRLNDIANLISSGLGVVFLSAIPLTVVCIAVAFRCLQPFKPRPHDGAIAGTLAVAVLGWCGVSSFGILKDITYLQSVLAPSAHAVSPPGVGILQIAINNPIKRLLTTPSAPEPPEPPVGPPPPPPPPPPPSLPPPTKLR